jgi:hypothetical protein
MMRWVNVMGVGAPRMGLAKAKPVTRAGRPRRRGEAPPSLA